MSDFAIACQPRKTMLEMFRSCRPLFFGSALAAGLSVGACTTQQESEFLSTWAQVCASIQTGAALAVSVTSNIPGISFYSGAITAAAAVGSSVCTTVEATVQKIIDEITSAGGAATASITQTGGNASAVVAQVTAVAARNGLAVGVRRLARGFARAASGAVVAGPQTIVSITIAPQHKLF